MRNLCSKTLGFLVVLLCSAPSTAQRPLLDTGKWALSAGITTVPIPSVLVQGNGFPIFLELSYYIKPKTTIDLGYEPYIHYAGPTDQPREENSYNANLSICRHPQVRKWLSLLYGVSITYEGSSLVNPYYKYESYGIGPGISFGAEIKLNKNFYLFNRTDIAYGQRIETANGVKNSDREFFNFRTFATGIKMRY